MALCLNARAATTAEGRPLDWRLVRQYGKQHGRPAPKMDAVRAPSKDYLKESKTRQR